MDAALYADGERRVLITQARNPSALGAWLDLLATAFPGRKRMALIEVPSDWREEDAAEMGRLLRAGFAKLTLVAAGGHPSIENLMRKIDHRALRRESAWA